MWISETQVYSSKHILASETYGQRTESYAPVQFEPHQSFCPELEQKRNV
ncbi:hypothetical protein ACPOL_6819 (plasmid) [Acidisarcina polymorpha]|uniref:Uncharacterized protein n=1 Tax=Acidisarcina polymorpha TaxID=2211140 RepID=A0A2Z5GAJ4_9BACT|nr:hypothetical protein ACPOL_6819 [Acidisarcina polymorpha]